MEVEVAKRWRKRVRLPNRNREIPGVVNFELIRKDLASFGYEDFEETRFGPLEHLAWRFVVNDQKYPLSMGAIPPHDPSPIGLMAAKNRVWILMPELHETLQLLPPDG